MPCIANCGQPLGNHHEVQSSAQPVNIQPVEQIPDKPVHNFGTQGIMEPARKGVGSDNPDAGTDYYAMGFLAKSLLKILLLTQKKGLTI